MLSKLCLDRWRCRLFRCHSLVLNGKSDDRAPKMQATRSLGCSRFLADVYRHMGLIPSKYECRPHLFAGRAVGGVEERRLLGVDVHDGRVHVDKLGLGARRRLRQLLSLQVRQPAALVRPPLAGPAPEVSSVQTIHIPFPASTVAWNPSFIQ